MRALLTINIFVIFMLLRGVSVAKGTLVNRTIDDAWGDSITGASPVYFPDGGFAQGSVCRTCNISPKLVDISKVFDGTWHDTTHHSGDATQVITATFTGTAVYVFNIIANTVPFTTTLTNLTFTLDGELVGHYVHSPDSSSDILYNVLVYSNASLMNTQHTIEMRPTGPFSSLILFDYIAYTVDEDAGSKPSSTIAPTSNSMIVPSTPNAQDPASILPPRTLRPLGAIIGAVVGGLCAVFLGIAALFCWRRQCAKRHGILLDAFQEPSPLRYPPLADMGLYNSAVVSTLSAPISAAQDMSQRELCPSSRHV
ncbi:hypothetical protein C8Q79DRAFT_938586 [Trametes meyenii]|nr:hypothetical protein C8Q79DRAFT_938586 [Trametes meyenii]